MWMSSALQRWYPFCSSYATVLTILLSYRGVWGHGFHRGLPNKCSVWKYSVSTVRSVQSHKSMAHFSFMNFSYSAPTFMGKWRKKYECINISFGMLFRTSGGHVARGRGLHACVSSVLWESFCKSFPVTSALPFPFLVHVICVIKVKYPKNSAWKISNWLPVVCARKNFLSRPCVCPYGSFMFSWRHFSVWTNSILWIESTWHVITYIRGTFWLTRRPYHAWHTAHFSVHRIFLKFCWVQYISDKSPVKRQIKRNSFCSTSGFILQCLWAWWSGHKDVRLHQWPSLTFTDHDISFTYTPSIRPCVMYATYWPALNTRKTCFEWGHL